MKGSVLKKFLCTCLVTAAALAATTISAVALTIGVVIGASTLKAKASKAE